MFSFFITFLAGMSFFSDAVAQTSPIVQPLLQGHWGSKSCPANSSNCFEISIEGDQFTRRTRMGLEIYEEKTFPFRLKPNDILELLDPQNGTVVQSIEYSVILARMKLCESPQVCLQYVRVPKPFQVTERKLKRNLIPMQMTMTVERPSGLNEHKSRLLSPLRIYPSAVKKGKFGRTSHYSWVDPTKKYLIQADITAYFTNEGQRNGKAPDDYGLLVHFALVDRKTGQTLSTSKDQGYWATAYFRNASTREEIYVGLQSY